MKVISRPGYRLALCGLFLSLLVIALGAYTRLVDAGLGCPDWPGCYGHLLWPSSPEEIARSNQAWPETPVNIERIWPEMVHRYSAALLGLLMLVLAILAVRQREPGYPSGLILGSLALVICQGLFGMWTVTLKLWPQVVTLHLLGGFATMALLWLIALRLRQPSPGSLSLPAASRRLRIAALLALLIVTAQIALGGWTTANYAALACPDLPFCQGELWPEADFGTGFNIWQQVGPNYLGGLMEHSARVAIHLAHRAGSLLTLVFLSGLALALLRRTARAAPLRRAASLLLVTLLLQFALGLSNVWFSFPLAVAIAHNLGGALLLLVTVSINYLLYTAGRAGRPNAWE